MEDCEKTEMRRQIFELTRPKITRDVSICCDQRTRLAHNMIKHQASSSIENINTVCKQVNTEVKTTRDSSCGASLDYLRYSEKACQSIDLRQCEYTSSLICQKGKLLTNF